MTVISAVLLTGACANPCNLPCVAVPHVLIAVTDQSGHDVALPHFEEGGAALTASCAQPVDAGTCSEWDIASLSPGAHTLTVSATGFANAALSTTVGAYGCCAQGLSVTTHENVQLHP